MHPRRWLYIEVGLAALLLLVHAFQLDEGAVVTPTYRLLVNSLDLVMLVILAWATWRRLRLREGG